MGGCFSIASKKTNQEKINKFSFLRANLQIFPTYQISIFLAFHIFLNKYIFLFHVSLFSDGSPGGQSVNDRFFLDWDSALVSSENIIVARLDGRGSGFQGQRVLHELHQRLGTVDVQDQIAAVEYVLVSLLSRLHLNIFKELLFLFYFFIILIPSFKCS